MSLLGLKLFYTIIIGTIHAQDEGVPGGWSEWYPWSPCSKTCSDPDSTRIRKKYCVNPKPAFGGAACQGNGLQTGNCNGVLPVCPVDSVWSDWAEHLPCSVNCGQGYITEARECPNPLNGGKGCPGQYFRKVPCNGPCIVNGQWTQWNSWSTCSSLSRTVISKGIYRFCKNPEPKNGGLNCSGEGQQFESCLISDEYMESANYPNDYPSYNIQNWKYTAAIGQRLKFVFEHFDTEERFDYVVFYDGFDKITAKNSTAIAGEETGESVVLSQNMGFVEFTTDHSIQHSGFRILVTVANPDDITTFP